MQTDPEKIAAGLSEGERGEQWRQVFIRVCRDSGFRLPMERAASLTGRIVGAHALQVWGAFPSLDTMHGIAAGTHPAVRKVLENRHEG